MSNVKIQKKSCIWQCVTSVDILSEPHSNEILGGDLILLYEVLGKFLYIRNHNKTKHDKNMAALAT
jgi:hypothetical protein